MKIVFRVFPLFKPGGQLFDFIEELRHLIHILNREI